ncbi:MAG: hypothetical protein L0Y54_16965 [Sporichthyaceae bacterium]|nr:hypothetical protein [Sporichthyaceae bacterium]
MASSGSGFVGALATDLLADVLFAAILAAAAIWLTHRARRKRVRRFFGVMPGAGSISVFLSSIVVKERGTVGIGPIVEGYHGPAITELEYRHVLGFAATVETKPFIRLLRAVLPDDLVGPVEPTVCQVRVSPHLSAGEHPSRHREDHGKEVDDALAGGCVVLVGSPVYNLLTHVVLDHPAADDGARSRFRFIRTGDTPPTARRGVEVIDVYPGENQRFMRTDTSELAHPGPINEYFVVEKLRTAHGRTIFICAGTCSSATAAALDRLTEWRELERRFGAAGFGLLCEIRLAAVDDREADPRPDRVRELFSYPGDYRAMPSARRRTRG